MYLNENMYEFPEGTVSWIDSSQNIELAYFLQNQHLCNPKLPTDLNNLEGKLWILIPLDSNLIKNYPSVIVTNPHINFIRAWWLNENKEPTGPSALTGDHMPFSSREISSPNFTFQNSNPSESKYLLLFMDKRYEILFASIHFSNAPFIQKRSTHETVLFGWLIGIVAMIFLTTIVLFVYARDHIYLSYGLFLFFMLVYSIADFGFLHWMFAFEQPRNLDSIRPISLALSFVLYVSFILKAINVKVNLPKSYRLLMFLFKVYVIFIAVAICVYVANDSRDVKYIGILISHYFQRGLLAILVLIVVQSALKKIPFALLISISLFLFLGVHFVSTLYENGEIPDKIAFQHFLPIIYTIDCLVMSVIVARTFLRFQKKSLDLSNELLSQNIEYTVKLNEVKEKDLTRISQYLHDNVGAEISAMRYELEALKNNPNPSAALDRIIAKSSFIANEVRNASHNLSPLMLERFGLNESVAQFLSQINANTSCNFQLDVIGEENKIEKNIKIILFQIIQEGIQNILKHAQAQNAIIQILYEPKIIQLFIEDDGVGFDLNNVTYGLGLEGIKQLIEFKQGIFKIDSEKNSGVKIYVELPNIQH